MALAGLARISSGDAFLTGSRPWKYNNITRGVICHGDKSVIKEGHKSFPSGHTSWSFAGLGFLSWYLAGKIKAFDRGGHVAKLCIVVLPLLIAAMVGVSRVDDYWHHWQDVFTGGILGLVVASFCYLQFFPPPAGEQGFWPHAYFEHILHPEVENQVQLTATSNHHQGLDMRTNNQSLDSMEEGRRARLVSLARKLLAIAEAVVAGRKFYG
uniref:Phosphatidic acid phosphatase type 2/haloperoxidase domain-containing protein n=1 Tax=Oryza glumipatula TaxID=40148 RepID=A0A0E0A2E7_9ORYZ